MQAAVVADRWHMDIIDVAREKDPLLWAIRAAGHLDLCDAEKEAAERQNR